MESSGTRNRDSSTRSTRKERPERLVGEGGGGGGGGGEVHHPSSGQRGRHQSVTIINRSDSDRDGDDDSNPSRRQQRKERERRAQRKMESEMDLALLSGDDDEPLKVEKKRPSRLKPPNPSAAEGLSTPLRASANDRHQQEDTVEARFGGRSKWFMGKVSMGFNFKELLRMKTKKGTYRSLIVTTAPGLLLWHSACFLYRNAPISQQEHVVVSIFSWL